MNELEDLDLSDIAELRPVERLWAAVAIQAIADATDPQGKHYYGAKVFVNGSTFGGIWEWTGLDWRVGPLSEVRDKVTNGPRAIQRILEAFRK